MKKISLPQLIIALTTVFFLQATTINALEKNYKEYPYWIEMMNDPSVNYFEAIKAYEEFWTKHEKPEEEEELIGEGKSESKKHSLFEKIFKRKKEREEKEARQYTLDVKKFEHWKMVVQPYIQEDGRILSAEERLKIWQDQKK